MNIKVAIRVRPFNPREKKLKTPLCIKMGEKTTYLLNEKGEVERTFNYDHCFWSFDGFKEDKQGYYKPKKGQSYADQTKVYKKLGKSLLNNALKGYHCCLFAYGQTGSGKSYSIFGYGKNKGIVPMICEELLNGKHLVKTDKKDYFLTISMLEIYNEKIHDLLIPVKKRTKGGLKVRENPKIGVYVEKLHKYNVQSYSEIEEIIEKGNQNKTQASTMMNKTSSRAHTIITLELIQKKKTLTKTTQKQSVIHLVDLAGSEKVKKTQATNDRLREACSINTSLTVLGRVINQLYEKTKGKKIVVSYRDSVLTRMLQNALGGNSKTTMVCAISPARDNYDETLSTLRYADQAKRIKLNAKINESETDKMIRELMEENEKLKSLLAKLKNRGDIDADETEDIQGQIRMLENVIGFKNDKKSSPNTMSSTLLLKTSKSFDKTKIPHIMNLNEDPLLSGMIFYNLLKYKEIRVVRRVDPELEENGKIKYIVLKGGNITEDHASLQMNKNTLTIRALSKISAANTFVNGINLLTLDSKGFMKNLKDLDRLIFGTNSTFLVRLPLKGKIRPVDDFKEIIDWEMAQRERFNFKEKDEKENIERKVKKREKELKQKEK